MTYKKFYFISLGALILACAYPIYMGIATIVSYISNGFIDVGDYRKYVIPYTPICIALIISVALLPVAFKLCKKYTLVATSALATTLFFIAEICFEQIEVRSMNLIMQLQGWQLSLCMVTPEVQKFIGKPIYAQNNPAFKIHFYIISIVIILAVINVIYGFSKMLKEEVYDKKRPLIAQAVTTGIFIGLCIFACFTAFYRTGAINISPMSATLMSMFFIVFGITVGVYVGSIFYGKKKLMSVIVPGIISSITTIVMYIGELILMGGILFKFGNGFLFEPIFAIPFAIIDFIVILISGIITYWLLYFLREGASHENMFEDK
ncbi:MAG: hypothetical protein K0R09_3263 [Clostridiales bacterium]|jgi:hypothetical protein|nr:hypothetical protein [Clostridiales bacterium]